MGQHACCSNQPVEHLQPLGPQGTVRLTSLDPDDFAPFSILAEANEALGEALVQGRLGQFDVAVEHLQTGEALLREAADSSLAAQLRRACCTDPELQIIREKGLEGWGPKLDKKRMRKKEKKEQKGANFVSEEMEKDFRSSPEHCSEEYRSWEQSPADEAAGGLDISTESSSLMASLEEEFDQVHRFCRSCHIVEAQTSWEALLAKSKVKIAERKRKGDSQAFKDFSKKLASDPYFTKLHAIHGRIKRGLTMLRRCADFKNSTPMVIQDEAFPKAFRMEFAVRPCEGDEIDKNGASTQLLVIVKVYAWPQPLRDHISTDVEADLMQPSWFKDCRAREATLGGEASLFSNFNMVCFSLDPLPISLEDVQIREFALMRESPIVGGRPGVLVVETGAPVASGKWENWIVPPPSKARGHYRLGAGMKVHYKMPSTIGPHATDWVSISKLEIPVPSYLLPVSAFKNILAKKTGESLRLLKEGMIDHWSELDFGRRIASNTAFYEAVAAIQSQSSASPV